METRQMVTKSRLITDLKQLGVTAGMKVFVHSAMKQIGWIPGGAQALIEALHPIIFAQTS